MSFFMQLIEYIYDKYNFLVFFWGFNYFVDQIKIKKKGELWNLCFIYFNFDEIIFNIFCIYCMMIIIIFLFIFGYLMYWFRINNCCVKLIRY